MAELKRPARILARTARRYNGAPISLPMKAG